MWFTVEVSHVRACFAAAYSYSEEKREKFTRAKYQLKHISGECRSKHVCKYTENYTILRKVDIRKEHQESSKSYGTTLTAKNIRSQCFDKLKLNVHSKLKKSHRY